MVTHGLVKSFAPWMNAWCNPVAGKCRMWRLAWKYVGQNQLKAVEEVTPCICLKWQVTRRGPNCSLNNSAGWTTLCLPMDKHGPPLDANKRKNSSAGQELLEKNCICLYLHLYLYELYCRSLLALLMFVVSHLVSKRWFHLSTCIARPQHFAN